MTGSKPSDARVPSKWPLHLRLLVQQYLNTNGAPHRALYGEIWLVLRTVIAGYSRVRGARIGVHEQEDICDLAAQKTLELLASIDSGKWNPVGESDGRVKAYLATVAHHGVVDILRSRGRFMNGIDPEALTRADLQKDILSHADLEQVDHLEASEFIQCLGSCVEGLKPRMRRLWFFRMVYEMPSKQIADHPEIRMTQGHVDVSLQRCRKTIGRCMAAKGMKLKVLPPGTFAALWELCIGKEGVPGEEEGYG